VYAAGRAVPSLYLGDRERTSPRTPLPTAVGAYPARPVGRTAIGTGPHGLSRIPYTRSSQNSVKRKSNFGEFTFHALR
jgi:hypothetical protein